MNETGGEEVQECRTMMQTERRGKRKERKERERDTLQVSGTNEHSLPASCLFFLYKNLF